MTTSDPATRSDLDFLGVRRLDEGRFDLVVEERLCRLDGRLYGGTALAVSVALAEVVTGAPAFWTTTQFVASAPMGAHLTVDVEVLAEGGRTRQLRVTGTDVNGQVVFASLGAACRPRPGGISATFEAMPTVDPPDRSEPWHNPLVAMAKMVGIELDEAEIPSADASFHQVIEYREPAILDHPAPAPGRVCLWAHRRDGVAMTRALTAFVADMVPLAISSGAGVVAGGVSLDNTIRFGHGAPTEWVLVDLRPHLASGGYGHGDAFIWNQRGELIAVASQIASMLPFDLAQRLADREQGRPQG